ncbi:MAG: hypothetical protein ACRDGE_06035 [Candidatus Limnocylindria bacterium]
MTVFVSATLAGPDTKRKIHARDIKAVSVVRIAAPRTTSFHGFEDVAGAAVRFKVVGRRLVIARFTTDSSCTNRHSLTGPLYCSVRIMISAGPGGTFVEMAPQPASHFEVFTTDGDSGSHAMERSFGPVRPGNYTVKVQFGLPFLGNIGQPSFSLRFSHLTVERARAA